MWASVTMAWYKLQGVGGGGGLQIRMAAVNALNKQSWTADKGWSSCLRGWTAG